jgi:phosphoribosylformimino-5-aminoimidazole carboxamide ribotide isomerase
MLLKAGIERVILSTAAVENSQLVREASYSFGDSLVVAIDARNGNIATHGWQKDTGIGAIDFAHSMGQLGVKRFIYTDTNRNATLTEPNFSTIFELVSRVRSPVIASGGISSISHLKLLQHLGVEGAIVGKALYTGDIDFKRALNTLSQT